MGLHAVPMSTLCKSKFVLRNEKDLIFIALSYFTEQDEHLFIYLYMYILIG